MEKYDKSYLAIGHRFINLNCPYLDIKLIVVSRNKEADSELTTFTYNFPREPIIEPLSTVSAEVFPDLNCPGMKLFGRYVELKKIYNQSARQITQLIYKAHVSFPKS